MTEQCEHEWRRYIDHERYYALFICDKPDCNAELSMQEAEIVLNKHAALKRENEAIKNLVVGRVNGEWPDGFDNEPDDWEEWSLQLYGHEAGDLLLGQEAWDHIVRGLKRAFLLTEEFTGGTTPTYFSAQDRE